MVSISEHILKLDEPQQQKIVSGFYPVSQAQASVLIVGTDSTELDNKKLKICSL